jgi:hypothetical protein
VSRQRGNNNFAGNHGVYEVTQVVDDLNCTPGRRAATGESLGSFQAKVAVGCMRGRQIFFEKGVFSPRYDTGTFEFATTAPKRGLGPSMLPGDRHQR